MSKQGPPRRFALWRIEIGGEVQGFVASAATITRAEARRIFHRRNPRLPGGVLAVRAVRRAAEAREAVA